MAGFELHSRQRLLAGASLIVAASLTALPVHAQSLGAVSASAGLGNTSAPGAGGGGAGGGASTPTRELNPLSLVRDQNNAAARALASKQRALNSQKLARDAQDAARRAAFQASRAPDGSIRPSPVPNGLRAGGLMPAAGITPTNLPRVVDDATGIRTWQGARYPTETQRTITDPLDPTRQIPDTLVTVEQTERRAILSWDSFNIGRETTLNFSQRLNGVVQPDWIALNRVVGQLDPATGRRDPSLAPAPSQILGRITSDATVLVINQNGVVFSATSQVNARSLIASTLEVGRVQVTANGINRALSVADRNAEFEREGLLGIADQVATLAETFSAQGVQTGTLVPLEALREGDIIVEGGARLTAGEDAPLLLIAPEIVNNGWLQAPNGQVGLFAGRQIELLRSEGGAANGGVRGLVAGQLSDATGGAYVLNTGIAEAAGGYVALGAGGAVVNRGVLASITTVSRNGVIDLRAVDVQLAQGSTILISPDESGATIPQAPASLANFIPSQVRISGNPTSRVEMQSGSLIYAPGGNVTVGVPSTSELLDVAGNLTDNRIFIDSGATIDVGGLKDVSVPATRNQVFISPVTRNELRDTPNYRANPDPAGGNPQAGDVVLENFLRSGVYVDPRVRGVRADGVRYVGSPLIEAESFYQAIGVTAPELLTGGGTISLGVPFFEEFGASGRRVAASTTGGSAIAPDVIVKPGATLDISGGWVTYEAGQIRTTQLITVNNQIIDISLADPNGRYIGFIDPFTQTQTRFGITSTFPNNTLLGVRNVGAYSEGRDAGALLLTGSAMAVDGRVFADAFAGELQRGQGTAGTAAPTLLGDRRPLQATPFELPAGGFLFVRSLGFTSEPVRGGADIRVTPGSATVPSIGGLSYGQSVSFTSTGVLNPTPARVDPNLPPGAVPATLLPAGRLTTNVWSADALSQMGLGQLNFWTSGSLTLESGAAVQLMPGGIFEGQTGRQISIAGGVSAPGGIIELQTYNLLPSGEPLGVDDELGGGSVFAEDPARLGSFDVVVTGELAAGGLFTNDFGLGANPGLGPGYIDGGSILIEVAPRVASEFDAIADETVTDVSGSILIQPGALLDVAAGAYVAADGSVDTSGTGGDLALISRTNYVQLANQTNPTSAPSEVSGEARGIRSSFAPGFDIATSPTAVARARNPETINAKVTVAPGSVRGHGFAGGGTFELATPAFAFGSGTPATGTELPRDFIGGTGFGTYRIEVLRTALLPNRFDSGLGGFNALLETEVVRIGSGQTLDLTRTQFLRLLDTNQTLALRRAADGTDIYSILNPVIPPAAFFQQGVDLEFDGLIEFDVDAGGVVTGAQTASIRAPKLRNAGTIRLIGGSIEQAETVPFIYDTGLDATNAIGLRARDLSEAFSFDPLTGAITEAAPSVIDPALTNAELAASRLFFFLGTLDRSEGIRLETGSLTDLSGAALINPNATTPGGLLIVDGRVVAGGLLGSAPELRDPNASLFEERRFGDAFRPSDSAVRPVVAPRSVRVLEDARLDLSGASASFARLQASGLYTQVPQWSQAGVLRLANSGVGNSIAGADITARGGDPRAIAGTIIAKSPILAETAAPGSAEDVLPAGEIEAAGFDTIIAQGSLTGAGDVTLSLGRAFILESAEPLNAAAVTNSNLRLLVSGSGDMVVEAPLIRFDSLAQRYDGSVATSAPGTGTATFRAIALDVEGALLFDQSLAGVTLSARDNLRLTGTARLATAVSEQPSLTGQLLTVGDLTLVAGQVYPTTGSSFSVAAAGADATIRIERSRAPTPSTPYSAGTALTIQAASVEQAGVVRAPLGTLNLGGNSPLVVNGFELAPATTLLTLEAGSLTSVAADGLNIPYGTTTDQQEYFFTPTIAEALTSAPVGTLVLSGQALSLQSNAEVNLSGGGDVYAYEFIPGVGGSRDVLSRFNSDPFSGNEGFQFADERQVYAIVPGLADEEIALIDPIIAADYGPLYRDLVGRRVFLEGGYNLAAGWYTLLPAQYALLPGGLRVVEQPEYGVPISGVNQVLLDGTLVTGGYYGVAGTNLRESELRNFTVQPQATFRNASNIATTQATETFRLRAERNGLTAPRSPNDAARLVLAPIQTLEALARFNTAPGAGGRAATADISGTNFLIFGTAPASPPADTILISDATLEALNVSSLFIGGTREDDPDGTTTLFITARSILIEGTADLSGPELLFATDGDGSAITVADGARLTGTAGGLDPRTGAYIIDGALADMTGASAVLRVSGVTERLVIRRNVEAVTAEPAISIGEAQIAAANLLADTTGDLSIANATGASADLNVTNLALGSNAASFTDTPGAGGLIIAGDLLAEVERTARFLIRAETTVGFDPGSYRFGAVTFDAPGLAVLGGAGAVNIDAAGPVRFANSQGAAGSCLPACGTGSFAITATEASFGDGVVALIGAGGGASLSASGGIRYDGVAGGLDAGSAPIAITTPFIADAALPLGPEEEPVQPALALTTTGALTITGSGLAAALPAGTPGARLTVRGDSVSVTDAALRATAGVLDLRSAGDVSLNGTASLATPGYVRVFGDADDPVAVTAPGGILRVTSAGGDILLGQDARLVVGGGAGRAGDLDLAAANGAVVLDGTIDASAPAGGGAFSLASGAALALEDLAPGLAAFTRSIRIETGAGDLNLLAGQRLAARDVLLSARGGAVSVAGTVDASGVTGGDISLYGTTGVTLAPTAVLTATASGYGTDDSRQAKGGNVRIGTDTGGRITLDAGSVIDVSARRPGDRLVREVRNQTLFYRVAEGDLGGTLSVRAPVIEQAGADRVEVTALGQVTGAREVSLEAYKRFDLAVIAADPAFAGVTLSGGTAVVDTTIDPNDGLTNFLTEAGAGTVIDFVQTLDISATPALAGLGAFQARPGVELVYSGDIQLIRTLNLGAGEVDLSGALAAGALVGSGNSLSVVAGREGDLLLNHTSFAYRVGGRITGAAGVFTIRADGDLRIEGAQYTDPTGRTRAGASGITDGFFAFRDQTSPAALAAALGGGGTAQPVLQASCSIGICSDSPSFTDVLNDPFNVFSAFTFDFGAAFSPGPDLTYSSRGIYTVAAAGGASGALFNQALNAADADPGTLNDPQGTAEVFPRLPGGAAPQSWSIQLVGGAADGADPLATRGPDAGDVIITGESSYSATAGGGSGGTTIAGSLLAQAGPQNGTVSTEVSVGTIVSALTTNLGLQQDDAVVLSFSFSTDPGTQAFLQTALDDFFQAQPAGSFILDPFGSNDVVTTLTLAQDFLLTIEDDLAPFLQAAGVYPPPAGSGSGGGSGLDLPPQYVRTRVRTGTGSIAIAAGGKVDTTLEGVAASGELNDPVTRTPSLLFPPPGIDLAFQAGSTAIYTAGVQAELGARSVTDPLTGQTRTIDAARFIDTSLFVPGSSGLPVEENALTVQPLYLEGGGDVSVRAGGSIYGRRDVLSSFRNTQRPVENTYRNGGIDLEAGGIASIRTNAQLFQTGFGTLGGGDIDLAARGSLIDLTVLANTSVLTADATAAGVRDTLALVTKGGGEVRMSAGEELRSGDLQIGAGSLSARAARVTETGPVANSTNLDIDQQLVESNALRVLLTDATVAIESIESITLRGAAAFAPRSRPDNLPLAELGAAGFYTPVAGLSLLANGPVTFRGSRDAPNGGVFINATNGANVTLVLPGSLEAVSLNSRIQLPPSEPTNLTPLVFLFPSEQGQLRLFAGTDIEQAPINMDDTDPGLLPSYFSAFRLFQGQTPPLVGRTFLFPAVYSDSSQTERSLQHNPLITHRNNPDPVRVHAGRDLDSIILNTPKQTRIFAGRDIVDMVFTGQNVRGAEDITRIVAGRDIVATTQVVPVGSTTGPQRPALQGNNFILGGPGALYLEAGRDAGPFLNSAVSTSSTATRTYGGGVRSIGNEYNPFLPAGGADVNVFFGVAPGIDYAGFRDYYVDPANFTDPDYPDELFVNERNQFDQFVANRDRPIYGEALVAYLQETQPGLLTSLYGTTDVGFDEAYAAFLTLSSLGQRDFLLKRVYFSELVQTSRPDSPSFGQPSRSYRAVDRLFPPSRGYTENSFAQPGESGAGIALGSEDPVETGNLDLRLATIQTSRGGDVTILGPGGRVLGGSTVRTDAQAERRAFVGERLTAGDLQDLNLFGGALVVRPGFPIVAIPSGLEGVLTLRGGDVNGFVDTDFLLNQSRLFTQGGGNIALFSSNGDLNAGQGSRSSANFPPVAVRINADGFFEVDALSGVSGAGIAAFPPGEGLPNPAVFLIAPAGTVDAGDAGVRVSGDLFVAAQTVANADNFAAGGSSFGVPTGAPAVNAGANAAASAATAAAQNAADSAASANERAARAERVRIVVDVLGFYSGDDPCDRTPRPAGCPAS